MNTTKTSIDMLESRTKRWVRELHISVGNSQSKTIQLQNIHWIKIYDYWCFIILETSSTQRHHKRRVNTVLFELHQNMAARQPSRHRPKLGIRGTCDQSKTSSGNSTRSMIQWHHCRPQISTFSKIGKRSGKKRGYFVNTTTKSNTEMPIGYWCVR